MSFQMRKTRIYHHLCWGEGWKGTHYVDSPFNNYFCSSHWQNSCTTLFDNYCFTEIYWPRCKQVFRMSDTGGPPALILIISSKIIIILLKFSCIFIQKSEKGKKCIFLFFFCQTGFFNMGFMDVINLHNCTNYVINWLLL